MRGFYGIGLHNPKSSLNVGSVLRAAGNYNAAFVAQSGKRCGPGITDTMKQYRHMPYFRISNLKEIIPYDCVPVAVDIVEGASSLFDYVHPERAFYIFGPEDGTLNEEILSWCRDIIYVPTNRCMNLAATVNVILYDRVAKRYEKENL